jgi:hypothetical protein
MPFKLSKKEIEFRDDLVARLEIASVQLSASISAANELIQTALAGVNEKVNSYNDVLSDAQGFVESVVGAAEQAIGEKSEHWQESDRGQAAQEFLSAWDDLEMDHIEPIEIDLIEEPDLAHRDDLENAPDQMEKQ